MFVTPWWIPSISDPGIDPGRLQGSGERGDRNTRRQVRAEDVDWHGFGTGHHATGRDEEEQQRKEGLKGGQGAGRHSCCCSWGCC